MIAQTMDRRKWRKLAVSLIGGMIAGAAGAAGMLTALDGGAFGALSGERAAALCVALVYLLMGLAVAFGAVAPRAGATFLNVEDADELREERAKLVPSAFGCIALAAGLAALALAGDAFAPEFAMSVFGASLAIAFALSRTAMARSDELMRGLMRDAGAVSFYMAFVLIGGWAALAHLGFTPVPTMLTVVTLFYAMTLMGSFWVVGRRGMLMPR